MDQEWFEMKALRVRRMVNASWIPLRQARTLTKAGRYAFSGYLEEFQGAGSVAFPIASQPETNRLGWTDVGPSHSHRPWIRDNEYLPSDRFDGYGDKLVGLHLVLQQGGQGSKDANWHLHQDLVLALGLFREEDVWVRPEEGYLPIAKLTRSENGQPVELLFRTEHLRDYLSARAMGLFVASYFSRDEILDDVSGIQWSQDGSKAEWDDGHWEGRAWAIHEGHGENYGSETAVFHATNSGLDTEEDVPKFDFGEVAGKSSTWKVQHKGRKLFRVMGEVWKEEWIPPADASPRVKGDDVPPTAFFAVDSSGTRESRQTLGSKGQWLWFRPELVPALLQYRDSQLHWYTKDTGGIGATNDAVHFGINEASCINVYAKDVGALDDWEQRIWAGFNISPEGKVSSELMDSQMRVNPAHTQAPEKFIASTLRGVDEAFSQRFGSPLFRPHADLGDIIHRCHRFRGLESHGLLALAKDLARLTADSIDTGLLIKQIEVPPGTKPPGSLKALERVLCLSLPATDAANLMGPLFGIYDLRLADAHLGSSKIDDAFKRADVDQKLSGLQQAYQLLDSFVSTLEGIRQAIQKRVS
ncbi:hypothetical protein [Cupriavidus pauculus]|uniref:hypothetical protein n=1 Tax=Cupriavidus pauculus TaxID=82633 RepID=UPI001FD5E8DE|nr:hypothetical protein [Cupriavidus pauculus]